MSAKLSRSVHRGPAEVFSWEWLRIEHGEWQTDWLIITRTACDYSCCFLRFKNAMPNICLLWCNVFRNDCVFSGEIVTLNVALFSFRKVDPSFVQPPPLPTPACPASFLLMGVLLLRSKAPLVIQVSFSYPSVPLVIQVSFSYPSVPLAIRVFLWLSLAIQGSFSYPSVPLAIFGYPRFLWLSEYSFG